MQALKGSRWFSAFDFHSGYLHIPLREEGKEKTSFRVLGSLYEFERMPFGLGSAALKFSRLMDKALGDYKTENWFELILDDIPYSCF